MLYIYVVCSCASSNHRKPNQVGVIVLHFTLVFDSHLRYAGCPSHPATGKPNNSSGKHCSKIRKPHVPLPAEQSHSQSVRIVTRRRQRRRRRLCRPWVIRSIENNGCGRNEMRPWLDLIIIQRALYGSTSIQARALRAWLIEGIFLRWKSASFLGFWTWCRRT